MAVRDILRMGHPMLLQAAKPVTEFNTGRLDALIRDMFETMAANRGAGLAAPQIGEPLRVVIFGLEENPRYPDAAPVPMTVLINPLITPLADTVEDGWEGCLSIPGMRGLVPRCTHIRYGGMDPQGRPFERTVDGFHARVVQHEVDHLDGILYPRRIRDLRRFGFEQELFPEQTPDDAPRPSPGPEGKTL